MCGICAKFSYSPRPPSERVIERMNDRLTHRGPDDSGVHCAPHIGLGQRRLAIIDLRPEGTAPLANETESVWVTFNGEIYNFEALRANLEGLGHEFRTRTDTEVLVHLYEEYGPDCVDKLRGMFALVIWDAEKRRLFAARDRLGQKPLYYAPHDDGVLLASEIKALLGEPEVSREPNYEAIDAYLTRQYIPAPVSGFKDIQKLPPGHRMVWDIDGNTHIDAYWRPERRPKTDAPRWRLKKRIRQKLREAVELRMQSDVPLGALLSGGIDSGAVVALMAESSSRPVETFSIGLEGFSSNNELPYARQVADRYDTDHHELVVQPEATEILPELVAQYDEPFADSSAIPTYYVSRMARRDVTVALAGDGGDESFAGYPVYDRMRRWSRIDAIPQRWRRRVFGGLESFARRLPGERLSARVSKGLTMLKAPLPERARFYRSLFKPQEKRRGYTDEFLELSRRNPTAFELEVPWEQGECVVDWMMRNDQSNYLAQCLNTKVDIASMANSLEVRAPFQDHELVEFASTIPAAEKWPVGGQSKGLLREAVRPLLPDTIIDKPKTGFTIPIGEWFRGELKELLRETLQDDRIHRRGLFQPEFLDRLVEEHISGRRNWASRLWMLVWLELWFRHYVD